MKIIRDMKMGEKSGFETFLNSIIFKTLWTSLYLTVDKINSTFFFLFVVKFNIFFNNMKILIDSRTIFGIYVWKYLLLNHILFPSKWIELKCFYHHSHNLYMIMAKLFLFCPANHEICIILKKKYFRLLFIQMAFKKSRSP